MWIYSATTIDWMASVFWLWQRPTCGDLRWASPCWETSRGWSSPFVGSRDRTRASWGSLVSRLVRESLLGPRWIRLGMCGNLKTGGLLEGMASVVGACYDRGEVRDVDTAQERRSVIPTSTAGVGSTWLVDWTRRCGRPSSVQYMSFSWLVLHHLWWSSCMSVFQTWGRTHRCLTYFWTGITHIACWASK